jgi:PKD repeat protein
VGVFCLVAFAIFELFLRCKQKPFPMKHSLRILLLACLLLSANFVKASGGPDAYGYTWITSLDAGGPTFNWIDITSRAGVQTVTGLADDNSAAGMINLGINFHYYWNDYTQLKVGSNGWTSFNSSTSNIASCFPTIPTAGGPSDNYLAPLMGDLNFTGAGNIGQVKYWSNNVDTFIISYINVPFWSVNAPGWVGSNSFQVILCSSDSSITYQYGSLGGFVNGAACVDMTVGIENSTGNVGLQVHSDAMPPNNYVIRFDYPSVVLLSIQDVLPRWNQNTTNGADFILQNTAVTLMSDIRNAGNAAVTTPINLQSTILNSASATVMSNTGSLPSLAASDDSIFTFATPWVPTVAGQYTNRTVTTNSQDINSANNTLNTELEVVNPCVSTINLSYVTGNTPDGSINWNGGAGDDGVAVYFAPPVYPYTVSSLQYYISSNIGNGYTAEVYDDDGPNGAPGTLLFSSAVPSSSVVSAAWNTVTVAPAVTLNSGGFYVVWFQGGTAIFLGTETAGPRSHHNYEILDGSWATFRYDDARDALIRAAITNFPSAPIAAFSSAVATQTASFTDNSTGLVTSWSWDFGDGSPVSTLQNPTHMYSSLGTYTVCLTATSPCTTSVICQTVNICLAPTATYSSSTSQLNAMFTDFSSGTVSSWVWDFGDSQTSTQQNPSHTYAAAGTYTVCLIVSNNCGDADTICQTVMVCSQPVAAFMNTNNLLSVDFTDNTTNSPVSWTWDFGDSQTSNQQNPTHIYSAGGTYNICLVVTNVCGDADTTCTTVTVCDQLVAAFSFTQNEDTVFVTDQSTGSAATWLWDFGDSQSATTQNAVHNYATGGIYTVCLTATDACGSIDSTCQQVFIVVTGMNETAANAISTYPNPVNDQLTISFAKEMKNAQLEIIDQTGRLVQQVQNISGQKLTLNVSTLPAGIYLLRVTDENGSSSARFTRE